METLMICLSKMNTPVGAEYLVVLGWKQKVRAVTKWVGMGGAEGAGRDRKQW